MQKQKKLKEKKELTFYEQYKSSTYCNQKIISKDFLDDLGMKLIEFGYSTDGSKGFVKFMLSLGIPWRTFHKWILKYPELKEDYEQAKLMLGEGIQENALLRKFDASLAKYILYNYLPEYKEIQKFLALTRDMETEEAKTKIVLIENLAEAVIELKKVNNEMV